MHEVLITGASSGIGYALTESFLQRGDVVWAGARKPETLKAPAEKYPGNLKVLKLDVTSATDIESAVQTITQNPSDKKFILVNNAGVALGGPIESLPLEEWKSLFEVNVFGLVSVTKNFLPRLRQNRGLVINIGSISGRISSPYLAPYCASKFAVKAISDALRRELRSHGVNVVLVEPGPIKTDIWDKSIHHSNELKKFITGDQLKVYGEAIENLNSAVAEVAKSAVPVSWVTDTVMSAINAKNPRAYYLVGKGIRIQAFLAKHLPTKWLDALLSMGYRFQAAKKKS
ncbi:SDR family oxidoreductase [Bdellovibrio sp. 22V]|uniref:SDR family oxidoreductase n=1 Tax=Bdellovibrio sp. 22V TaxID=3044166 RepID=UPI0025429670|nr:SDR family oxidoreductase [Bdellovibrio sp. 22V]WII73895.1 SDR family oxidoreductase [Bdellovibrio sp. 22V]